MLSQSSSRHRLRYVWLHEIDSPHALSIQDCCVINYCITTIQTTDPSSTGPSSLGPSFTGQQTSATSTIPLSTNTSGLSSSSLSTGASVGIGIGAGVAVLVLALLGWLIHRRRKKSVFAHKETLGPAQEIQSISTGYYQHGNSARTVSQSPLQEAPSSPATSPPAELDGRS